MGIVAYCPSGHRMKVKDHLAGRKGICPTCGARFRIPLASMTASARAAATLPPAASFPPVASFPAAAPIVAAPAAGLPTAAVASLDPADAVGLPRVLLLTEPGTDIASRPDEPPLVDPDPTADVVLESEADEPTDGAAADELFWFVAIPGGQPSAAMKDPEMRAWLDSGQATGGEVVWRSDWADWKPISAAFPETFPVQPPGAGGW
jgi:hypothetical protein